ncbi:MAG: type II toxin-antitoxin system VapC family toxin [Actinomycetia bacterium]|nr:type II toxin-antitoxin system VapC family toxin [Actinomycetes bacterium]
MRASPMALGDRQGAVILDTNVVSEVMRENPHPRVVRWLRATPSFVLTAVGVAEIRYSLARMPAGRRRETLVAKLDQVLAAGPMPLAFDEAAATTYGPLRAQREAAGRAMTVEDCMIASMALSRGLPLATRNTRDFAGLGLALVNPWD